MTEEVNVTHQEVAVETTAPEISPVSSSSELSIEEQARADNWVPKDEFKGNPENWVDAKEYLRVSKIIKSRDEKANKLEREIKELKTITKSMLSTMQKQEVIAYEKASKDLEARLHRAKEIGDVEEALDVSRRQQELHQNVQQKHIEQNKSLKDTEEFQSFYPRNKWVMATDRKSKAMQSVASDISYDFAQANPNASLADELNHIDKEMRLEFPEYFERETAKTSPAVLSGSSSKPTEGSSNQGAPTGAEKSIIDFLKKNGYDYKTYAKAISK